LFTLGTTAIAASTVSTIAGMVSITDIFCCLTGNASTATALAAEQFLEQVKLRLLQVLLMERFRRCDIT
jgi:hypothetical protein